MQDGGIGPQEAKIRVAIEGLKFAREIGAKNAKLLTGCRAFRVGLEEFTSNDKLS